MSSNEFSKATKRLLYPEPIAAVQDIPGAGASAAEGAGRHTRVKITINLDGEVVDYFKQVAKEETRSYQSLINQVLREYVAGSRPEHLTKEIEQRLLSDQRFLDEIAKRLSD